MATRPYWLSFGASAVSGLAPTFIHFRTTAGGTLSPPSISEPGSFGMYLFNHDPLTQVAFICDGATSGLSFNDRYVQGVLDPFDQFGVTLNAIGLSAAAMGTSLSALGSTLTGLGNTAVALGISNFAFGSSIYALGVSNYAFGASNYALGVSNFALGTSNLALGTSIYAFGVTNSALVGNTSSSFGTDSADPTTIFGFLKRAQETREGNETYTKSSGSLTISSRGSSQLLATKSISDTTTSTTKT